MFKQQPLKLNRAFTVIELLVVISVIALLISLVLPSLKRARDLAIRSVCASNYRQLQIGSFSYASDSKDAVPWLNTGGYGALGYGGPTSGTDLAIASDPLSRFSNDYLDNAWTYNTTTARFTIPKVMIDPGIYKGMLRTYQNAVYSNPDIGQITNIGTTIGFGSFMGEYHNNTSADRSGIGSNGGINGRWRLRDPGSDSGGVTGLQVLRYQEFLNPSADVTFIDIEFQNAGPTTRSATLWSIPHGSSPTQPDGINQGFADGTVRWFNHNQMNFYYQTAYPWSTWMYVTPMCIDLYKPALFNNYGYPSEFGYSPTTLNWYGVTTPQVGGIYTP